LIFQCVASYQQLDAVGYVLLASTAAIGCDCEAVANASRAYSKGIAGSDGRGALRILLAIAADSNLRLRNV
jgi:hypothetical protein